MKAPDLIVRRARAALWAGLLGGLLFLMIGAGFALHAWRADENLLAAGFVLLAGFAYAWQHFDRLRLDQPVVAIADDGLRLPGVGEAPIGWDRIAGARAATGFAFRAGRRVDLELDAETFVTLRLGQVFLGDAVTKLRGVPYGVSIHTRGLDHDAAAIFAAMRRHWPPAAAED